MIAAFIALALFAAGITALGVAIGCLFLDLVAQPADWLWMGVASAVAAVAGLWGFYL